MLAVDMLRGRGMMKARPSLFHWSLPFPPPQNGGHLVLSFSLTTVVYHKHTESHSSGCRRRAFIYILSLFILSIYYLLYPVRRFYLLNWASTQHPSHDFGAEPWYQSAPARNMVSSVSIASQEKAEVTTLS